MSPKLGWFVKSAEVNFKECIRKIPHQHYITITRQRQEWNQRLGVGRIKMGAVREASYNTFV